MDEFYRNFVNVKTGKVCRVYYDAPAGDEWKEINDTEFDLLVMVASYAFTNGWYEIYVDCDE